MDLITEELERSIRDDIICFIGGGDLDKAVVNIQNVIDELYAIIPNALF
jgi:hypothetical protein